MSTFTKLNWPIQDLSAVAPLQDLASPGNLVLNGTFADPSIPNQISFIKTKVIRSISISSSTYDYTGTSFTIAGFQNGAYVTENIPGPGIGPSNAAYGTKYYDIIISVTASTAVTGIRAGTGNAGFLPLIVVNTVATTVINYSATVLLPSGSGINYSLFQTLDQVNNNYLAFNDQLTTKFFPALGFVNETSSQIGNSSEITNFVLLKVNSSANPPTDTFDFIFLQE
jgi:hypothetical protein